MKTSSEQEMLAFGEQFAKTIKVPSVIELIGDVGAGKTTFVRGLAAGLGIKEPITSPSFTISKSYALPNGGNLVHYDFYRLEDPGIMQDDLTENLKNPQNIIVIEWGESIENLIPKNHVTIKIDYNDDGTRKVTL
ncbi:tRNA (adenosine(37)-N6)-threonylcarbamoyltransferase complex ATPase subunit type 1 TsaE [Candidatus Saccharibacteria bacterium]|nr:tRNA (adenosine(37)-N6)-threonylcarbamoyltransferase complex ATPase subunit type 1 TsaE [Candidatus Saccharibacteria bacterium]